MRPYYEPASRLGYRVAFPDETRPGPLFGVPPEAELLCSPVAGGTAGRASPSTPCAASSVSPRTGSYAWVNRPPSAWARRDGDLHVQMHESWEANCRTFKAGAPCTPTSGPRARRCRRSGLPASCGRKGSRAGAGGAGKLSRRCGTDARRAADLVDRNFGADGRDLLWLADITHVRTDAGWLYLPVTVDAWNRWVVGWAMETHLCGDRRAGLGDGGRVPGAGDPDPPLRRGRLLQFGAGGQGPAQRRTTAGAAKTDGGVRGRPSVVQNPTRHRTWPRAHRLPTSTSTPRPPTDGNRPPNRGKSTCPDDGRVAIFRCGPRVPRPLDAWTEEL